MVEFAREDVVKYLLRCGFCEHRKTSDLRTYCWQVLEYKFLKSNSRDENSYDKWRI